MRLSIGIDSVSTDDVGASVDAFGDRYLRRVYTDADGRFVVDGLPAELAKFAIHTADEAGDPHIVISPTIEL